MEIAAQPPATSRLFPLPRGSIESYLATFGQFNEDELAMIEGSNRFVEPTDMAYPLLNLHQIPELVTQQREGHPRAEARTHAYRAGVCIGLALVRGRLQTLEGDGVSPPPLTVDPRQKYDLDRDAHRNGLTRLLRPIVHLDKFQSNRTLGFVDYLEDETMALHLAHTRFSWMGKMDFTSRYGIDAHDDEYINVGLLHTFALANAVEGQPPVDHRELKFAYDAHKHFPLADRLGRWDGGFRIERIGIGFGAQELEEGLPDLTPLLQRQLRGGYKGYAVAPLTVDGPRGREFKVDRQGRLVMGEHKGLVSRPDTWGDTEVPVMTQLTHVRRFESGFVMGDPQRSTELTAVGYKDSVTEFALRDSDVVVTQGWDGSFFTLPSPFIVPVQMGRESTACADLIALCRGGKVTYLKDVSDLGRPEISALHQTLESATEHQIKPGLRDRLGRVAMRRGVMLSLPPAVAFAVHGDTIEWQLASVGSGLGVAALLFYLASSARQGPREYVNPSRYSDHPEDSPDE